MKNSLNHLIQITRSKVGTGQSNCPEKRSMQSTSRNFKLHIFEQMLQEGDLKMQNFEVP